MAYPPPVEPSERLTRTLNFINRAREQLNEKRNNVRTLVEAEDLYVDEQKFHRLLHINLVTLQTSDQLHCWQLLLELGDLKDDFKVSSEFRTKYRAERAGDLDGINQREGLCTPCPSFKVTEIFHYSEETVFIPNQSVPELGYRSRQGAIYFNRLLEQHTAPCSPEEREALEKPVPRQGLPQAPCSFELINSIPCPSPRVSNRDYLLRPEAGILEEFSRVFKSFLEETITQGPEKNNLLEYLPLVKF